jgi:hypothetical protein
MPGGLCAGRSDGQPARDQAEVSASGVLSRFQLARPVRESLRDNHIQPRSDWDRVLPVRVACHGRACRRRVVAAGHRGLRDRGPCGGRPTVRPSTSGSSTMAAVRSPPMMWRRFAPAPTPPIPDGRSFRCAGWPRRRDGWQPLAAQRSEHRQQRSRVGNRCRKWAVGVHARPVRGIGCADGPAARCDVDHPADGCGGADRAERVGTLAPAEQTCGYRGHLLRRDRDTGEVGAIRQRRGLAYSFIVTHAPKRRKPYYHRISG